MLTGYPWDPLGVIWLPLSPVAGVARLVGTYALSGITVAVAGALLLAVHRRWRFPVATLGTVAALALAATASTGGFVHDERTEPVRVRIIQPNLGEEERPGPDYAENNLRALDALAGAPGPVPRLIVWPEGALRFLVEDGYPPDYYWQGSPLLIRERIASRLGPRDIVLAGGNALVFDGKANLVAATNSVFALDASARLRGRYDKAHLVPFGEYLPLRPLLGAIGMSRLVPGDIDFADGPGPGRGLILPDFGNIGMDICYEIIFSGDVVDKAHRPRLIFNPSNDSWFGSWGPAQHLAQARLRAIEEGLPILRATPTGISAIISADGRLLATVPPHTAGAIELPLPEAHSPTLFARMGNWMAVLVAATLLFLAVAIRRAAR
jgi:apolipoprotein N-acyltransferase